MTITLQTKSGIFEFEAADGETVLFSGLQSGLTLPYECATGTCGTCRARVMEGAVEDNWPEAPGAAKLKRDKGDILMCQSRASGACVVRVPSQIERIEDTDAAPARVGARIAQARHLTPDVIHFDVDLDREIAFQAGQFMVVTAPGIRGGRAYSMVNYAPKTRTMSFVVKQRPDGAFSDWLFSSDIVGAELSMFGPLGNATLRPGENFDLVCITGGSGIAGIMSILDHATQIGYFPQRSGHVYFGVRTLADAFYLKELADMAARSGDALKITLALSHEAPPSSTHPEFASIALAQGFVHEIAAQSMPSQTGNAIGFVAGPPPMVDAAIRVLLSEAGLTPARIRYDKFG